MGLIYKITNIINKKIYIGYTTGSLFSRINKHKNDDPKYNTLLGNAIVEYGWDNFVYEIVAEEDDRDKLLELEVYYINFFNSKAPNGYNMTIGGTRLYGKDNPFWNHEHSEETKRYLSELAKSRNGEKNPFYKKHHTKKSKELIGEKNSEPIVAIDDNGFVVKKFKSQTEAAKWCKKQGLTNSKYANSDISKRCKDGKKSFGYFWKYDNEGVETMPDECKAVG